MMKKIIQWAWSLYRRYEEIANYLVVGVCTTIVSWGACFLVERTIFNPNITWQNAAINTIGWLAGVIFGYFTNRKFVFKSKNPRMLKEFIGFTGGRVSTWILDIVVMELFVNVIQMDYWIAKIFISSVLVTIANYLISKIFVFKK